MTKEILLHPLARKELNESTEYYAEINSDLAGQFLDDFENAIEIIRNNPLAFTLINETTRRLPFHKFPYSMFYSVRPELIRILAIAHQSRRPLYWSDRA